MIFLTYNSNIHNCYKYPLCSVAAFTSFVLFTLATVGPFIFAYNSQGLWLKTFKSREQPNITFKHDLFLQIQDGRKNIYWTPETIFMRKVKQHQAHPLIKTWSKDTNFDQIPDGFNLHLQVGLNSEEGVHEITIILIFNYELKNIRRIKMESATIIQFSHWRPVTLLKIFGDLTMHQNQPFDSSVDDKQMDQPVLPRASNHLEDWKLEHILKKYLARDVSTKLTNVHTVLDSRTNSTFLDVQIEILYPPQTVIYKASFWYLMKWAWIQYLSIFTIGGYCLNKIRRWLFTQRIIKAYLYDHYKKVT